MSKRLPESSTYRKRARHEPYDRVLIVCGGQKTEPLYFNDLAIQLGLTKNDLEIVCEGLDPMSLVKLARKLQSEETGTGERFDQVYCVFDRDEFSNFEAASNYAKRCQIASIRSWPCFEYWFLLHYTDSRQPFSKSSSHTAAESCVSKLRSYWYDYEKNLTDTFENLSPYLESALKSARIVLRDAQETNEFNPSTEVHILICFLRELRRRRE